MKFAALSNLLLLSCAGFAASFVSRNAEQKQNLHGIVLSPERSTSVVLGARKKANTDDKENENENNKPEMDPAKRAALNGVLSQIERNYGRGSVVRLGDASHMSVESMPTGSLTLDAALGGGYPKGRVVEIYGPESSGKTTLALHAIAECQKKGGTAAFVDAEHALDPVYAAGLGIDVDELYVSQPDCGEMALDIVDKLVRSSAVDVIVVDSVAALVPRVELEGDMSDSQIGLQARLMSKAMRKITGSLALSQCTVIFLNQLRSKVGVIYGSPEVTSGGNALKFYSSVRLDTRRKEILPDNIGIRVKVKVVKNKVAAPFKAVMLDIIFGSGIDSDGCMLDAAMDLGIIDRKGSWYAYNGDNLAQGRLKTLDLLKANESTRASIENDVRLALSNYGREDDVDFDADDDESGTDIPEALDANMEVSAAGMAEDPADGFE
jgi:recombination protein RecA